MIYPSVLLQSCTTLLHTHIPSGCLVCPATHFITVCSIWTEAFVRVLENHRFRRGFSNWAQIQSGQSFQARLVVPLRGEFGLLWSHRNMWNRPVAVFYIQHIPAVYSLCSLTWFLNKMGCCRSLFLNHNLKTCTGVNVTHNINHWWLLCYLRVCLGA